MEELIPINQNELHSDFDDIYKIINVHTSLACEAVNREHLQMCWEVGNYISQRLRSGKWGNNILSQLRDYILRKDPMKKGFGKSNLYNMVKFYESYSTVDFSQFLNQFKFPSNFHSLTGKCNTADNRRENNDLLEKDLIFQSVNGKMPDILEITSFTNHTLKNRYPNAVHLLKDKILVDFLGIPTKHTEKHLHKAIVEHMKEFILEMGKDFIFMGSEYPIQVGGETYHIDLLFYHRALQCLVAVELKSKTYHPKDKGQLEFYLEALDRDVKRANENPTIGMLLCPDANETVVEYSLNRSMSPMMVAQYKQTLIPKEVVQKALSEFVEFISNK